jgi:flagellar biosynthesis chaperone FliJ
MARDPLRILLSIRRRAVEQARYALGACLVTEAGVADRIRSLDDTVRRDHEVSKAWQESHQFLEMSAIRTEVTRTERRTISADLAVAGIRSEEARGVVSAARTAAEAVEQLIGERLVASQADAARREQHVLDDIARARRATRQGSRTP